MNGTEPRWIPIAGQWRTQGRTHIYQASSDMSATAPFGILLSDRSFRDGVISVKIRAAAWDENSAARVVVGYDARTKEYLSIGLGGYQKAFVLSRFRSSIGWYAETAEGDWRNLEPDQWYDLNVTLRGQTVALDVDGVRVFDSQIEEPAPGTQIGLYAKGLGKTEFQDFTVLESRPRGFVVMHFAEPYDSLYREVLAPVASTEEVELRRADEISGPGIILQDIVKDIAESTVVVAEITPPNPNVFYELGYAHALNKPTILLVKRGERLPFDVAGFRCVFYDDSISGKRKVEEEFRRHLRAILGKN